MSTATRNFNISVNEEGESVATFVSNGIVISVPETHPNYPRIAHALINGEDPNELLDINAALKALSGKVTVENGLVKYEGEPIHNSVATAILRYQREGRDFDGLVKFLQRVQQNPSKHSRDQLYTWLERQDLSVDPEGYFLAFKGVNDAPTDWVDEDDDDSEAVYSFSSDLSGTTWDGETKVYASSSSGKATVDGVNYEGKIPNFVGATVTMDRREVDDDFSADCSYGLHVGSFRYASGFAQHLLEVRVAPEDVVSVPRYDTNKLRTCSYQVLGVQEQKVDDVSHWEAEATFDDEDVLDELDFEVPETWKERLLNRIRHNHRDVV